MPNVITLTNIDNDLTYELPDDYAVNTDATQSYITVLKDNDVLPFNKGVILYSSNLWDFTGFTKQNVSSTLLKFNFEKISYEVFREDAKNYVLLRILENIDKIQSIHAHFYLIVKFFNFAESKGIYDSRDLDYTIAKEFLELIGKDVLLTSQKNYIAALSSFYNTYSANFRDLMCSELENVLSYDSDLLKAQTEQGKTPDIPKDYFDNFLSAIIKIIDGDDNIIPFYIKGTACIYLILSQTGLRISECLDLEVDMLRPITLFNGEKVYFLRYRSPKGASGNDNYIIGETFVNELAKKGYDTLLRIYNDRRTKLDIHYLYLGGEKTSNASKYPMTRSTFSMHAQRLFLYMDEVGYIKSVNLDKDLYPQLTTIVVNSHPSKRYREARTLTIPTPHQFRVHMASELYKKGVPLKYIEKFMAHLSNQMEGYYVRPTVTKPQEDMEFSLKTIKKIVSGEIKILGDTNGLSKGIQEFIKKGNFNVKKDMAAICQSLVKEVAIRQKTGGVCIKASLIRPCPVDYTTDEFYCAYEVCPNIFHFFYMADVSYRQVRECEETFLYNKENGFKKAAQKELNKLQRRVKEKLIPELDELKKVIERKGVNAVLEEYPDLFEVIENMDKIYNKEIKKWQSMKM
jgi:integrase